MARVILLTHADVIIDPEIPVPDWGLNPRGILRHESFNITLQTYNIKSIYCSLERKAQDAAALHATALNLSVAARDAMGENDRSATGYLPSQEFQATADAFFAQPETSIRGWERAVDAQARFVKAVKAALKEAPQGDVLIVAHGGVGCLLLCHLLGEPISRHHDQPGAKGGCWFSFDRRSRQLIHGWREI